MLRFAAGENVNNAILRGILRQLPELDVVRFDNQAHGQGGTATEFWAIFNAGKRQALSVASGATIEGQLAVQKGA